MKLNINFNYKNKDNKKCFTKDCENKPRNLMDCFILIRGNVVDDYGNKYLLACDECIIKLVEKAIKTTRKIEELIKTF